MIPDPADTPIHFRIDINDGELARQYFLDPTLVVSEDGVVQINSDDALG